MQPGSSHTCPTPSSPLKRKRSSSPTPPLPPPAHLPAPQLLLALPGLLALPPTHPHYTASLRLSVVAVRRCIQLKDHAAAGMTPDLECRAWTTFVELGMKIVGAGLSGEGPEGEDWARGLENEIGAAIGKGLVLAQKHPSLHLYAHHLTVQHAQLAHWQHNHKFARALLRRHVASLSSADPHAHHYTAHLTLVSLALASNPVDIPSALHSLAAIQSLAEKWKHPEVHLLAQVRVASSLPFTLLKSSVPQVIKLRALISALRWADVFPLLETLEPMFGLSFPDTPKPSKPDSRPHLKPMSVIQLKSESSTVSPLSPKSLNAPEPALKPVVTNVLPSSESGPTSALKAALELHVLALGVLTHIQAGHSSDASKRIARLHTALDSGVLDREGVKEGVVEVPMEEYGSKHIPLFIHVTHPRVFFHLAFLVSAVAMRDATGRRPKPKVFAAEGLAVCERERPKKGQRCLDLPWTGLRVRQDVEERLTKIEADLLCELVGVCIQRSEFDEAEEQLARLIAHVRTHDLWDVYSARVTLYHAHLAHALSRVDRALECYRVAAHLAGKEEHDGRSKFVRVAAQAGEVGLRIGMARTQRNDQTVNDKFRKWGRDVAKECRALGGTLEAVGRVLEACLTEEIVLAKNHLKASLSLTTHALDNHLRALVLALASSHYLHTSSDYAEMMLTTARQLSAGLGAPASKSQDPQVMRKSNTKGPRKVGNAPLGLWVGQRFLELYRRTGRDKRAKQQDAINAEFICALEEIQPRGKLGGLQFATGAEEDGDGDVGMNQ
ncbi:hypothetical protein K439DRAFT_1333586 [Ramaria rubella]|nr:hypothetical protein K439DRAFT_1333586 [Ramaria rubella]